MMGQLPVRRTPRRDWYSLLLGVAAALALALLALPVVALVLGVPWGSLPELLGSADVGPAITLSIVTTLLATLICLGLGVPLAWWMARMASDKVRYLRALVLLPLVLPPVAGGVALLLLFGGNGPVGRALAGIGVSLPFSTAAVVLSQVFVAIPFMVLAAEAAFRGIDPQQFAVARTLGASQWRQFVSVALPLAAPGIAAGALLSWARTFGEFGATVTFAGSLPGVTETLPLAIYRALEADQDAAIALALVMLVMSVAVVLLLGARWLPVGGFGPPATAGPTAGSAGAVGADPGEPAGAAAGEGTGIAESGPAVDRSAPGRPAAGRAVTDSPVTNDPTPEPPGPLRARIRIRRPDFEVDVALTVPAGETTVVTGPNGAGKSTILLAVCGLLATEDAEISVAGQHWDHAGEHLPVAERQVGWVPQSGQLFGHMSVRDNVAFGLWCRGMSRAQARSEADLVLAEHGMSGLADRRAATLSGGQARRVAVLRAIAVRPQVLLLDEPTAGLDERALSGLVGWLRLWLAQYPKPTIVVTHDQEVAEVLGTRRIVLRAGRVVGATGSGATDVSR